jgi:hypothetical protein
MRARPKGAERHVQPGFKLIARYAAGPSSPALAATTMAVTLSDGRRSSAAGCGAWGRFKIRVKSGHKGTVRQKSVLIIKTLVLRPP